MSEEKTEKPTPKSFAIPQEGPGFEEPGYYAGAVLPGLVGVLALGGPALMAEASSLFEILPPGTADRTVERR